MTAIKSPEPSCTVANASSATAQLSLKQLAWRALSDSCTVANPTDATAQHDRVAAVARVASVARVAAVADRPTYDLRLALLVLADRHGFDPAPIHRLHNLDVAACARLDDSQLLTYLELLNDSATRWEGKKPAGHDAAIHCRGCGPVWVHPSVAAVLPVVDGWPRALGCPWCAIRKAGAYFPRPPTQCAGCSNYRPGQVNPEAALGQCAKGRGSRYPMQKHACDAFSPVGEG